MDGNIRTTCPACGNWDTHTKIGKKDPLYECVCCGRLSTYAQLSTNAKRIGVRFEESR